MHVGSGFRGASLNGWEPTGSFANADGGTTIGNGNYAEGGGWGQLEIDGSMAEHTECNKGYVNMGDISGDDGS